MPLPNDPGDLSKLRSIEPINTDPDAPKPTTWDKIKHNFSMLVQISKNRPLSEITCLKEAFIFGKQV